MTLQILSTSLTTEGINALSIRIIPTKTPAEVTVNPRLKRKPRAIQGNAVGSDEVGIIRKRTRGTYRRRSRATYAAVSKRRGRPRENIDYEVASEEMEKAQIPEPDFPTNFGILDKINRELKQLKHMGRKGTAAWTSTNLQNRLKQKQAFKKNQQSYSSDSSDVEFKRYFKRNPHTTSRPNRRWFTFRTLRPRNKRPKYEDYYDEYADTTTDFPSDSNTEDDDIYDGFVESNEFLDRTRFTLPRFFFTTTRSI